MEKKKFEGEIQRHVKEFVVREQRVKGMTQDDVAKKIGLKRSHFNNLLNGVNDLKATHLNGLAELFKVSEIELIGGIHPGNGDGVIVSKVLSIVRSGNPVARGILEAGINQGFEILSKKEPPASSISEVGS